MGRSKDINGKKLIFNEIKITQKMLLEHLKEFMEKSAKQAAIQLLWRNDTTR